MIVATYNIQRGRGLDFVRRLSRAIDVLSHLHADVIGLQEVVREPHGPRGDQAGDIARALGMNIVFQAARPHGSGLYGVALLSKHPIEDVDHVDLSVPKREPRVALRANVLRTTFFVCHFGLGPRERAMQAGILRSHLRAHHGPRVVMGDFNEWSHGPVAHALESELGVAKMVATHPAAHPILPLDRIYSDAPLSGVHAHRVGVARVASDHLPLVARL